MANYVVHYTKKLEFRRYKEEKLRRLIAQSASEPKLLCMAEEVRNARIRAIRMLRAKIVPCGGQELKDKYAAMDAEINVLQATPAESILAEFLSKKS